MTDIDKDDPVLKALRRIIDKGHKILIRPNGQISGIIPKGGEEPYRDEKWEVKRWRFKYYDLDGEENYEPRDAYNKKTSDTESIVPIEHDGGVAVTELTNPSGKLKTILVGRQATALKEQADNVSAMESELNRLGAKLKRKEKRDTDLAKKIDNLERERDEAEEDLEHFRTANERLRKQAESWRQVAIGANAELDQAKTELEQLMNTREITAEKIKQIAEDFSELKFSEMDIPEAEGSSLGVEGEKSTLEEAPPREEAGEEEQGE